MAEMMSSNRGISPLLATVLLIAFSIGLGAVVMAWGEKYVQERAEFVYGQQDTIASCERVSFEIVSIDDQQQACVRGSTLELMVENNGDIQIHSMHASIVGTAEPYNKDSVFAAPLNPGNVARTNVAFSGVGIPRRLTLKPTVLVDGNPAFCGGRTVAIEPLRSC